jgi:formate hydrogenlyase subunit 3/multisubunit Na+/H+ antiporter MnhD subunit
MIFPLHEPVTTAYGTTYGGSIKGGSQYMVYASLALPGLMVTQLLLEQFAIFPSDVGLLQTATVLLGLSLAMLLGAVPFQAWLSSVAEEGAPPVVTFIFTVNLGTVWFLLLAYLQSYTWLSQQAAFASIFTVVGLAMMVIGGMLAASQRGLGRMVGYATLVDNGALFVALGSRQFAGLSLSIVILMARPVALALMTVGLDGLRRYGNGSDDLRNLRGAAWVAPWRTLAFVIGGVALAGFPISLSFYARWGLYRLLAQVNLIQAVLGLLGSAGVMMGVVNAARAFTAPLPEGAARQEGALDRVVLLFVVILIGATLGMGLFPQVASRVALQMVEGLRFFAN